MSQAQFDLFVSEFEYIKENIKDNNIETLKESLFYCYQDFFFDTSSDERCITYDDVQNNYNVYIKLYNEWYNIIYNYLPKVTSDFTYHGGGANIFDNNPANQKALNNNLPYFPKANNNYIPFTSSDNGGTGGGSGGGSSGGGSSTGSGTNNERVVEVLNNMGKINNYTDEGRDNG